MTSLDATDLEILELLVEDARRPYREIAEAVGKSPPTVSDRIDRLREHGVIRRFTVDVDRSTIRDDVAVLVTLRVGPDATGTVRDGLVAVDDRVVGVLAVADAVKESAGEAVASLRERGLEGSCPRATTPGRPGQSPTPWG